MGHVEGVGLGLSYDTETHHGDPVAAQHAAIVFSPPLNGCDIAQSDQVTVASLPYHQLPEIISGIEQPRHPHGELLAGRFHATGGKLHVLASQGLFDVGNGNVLGSHGLSVEPDPHGVTAGTAHPHPGDAVQH